MPDPIGRTLGAGFGVLSRRRGHRRSIHPDGVGFALTLTPEPGAPDVDRHQDLLRQPAQPRLTRAPAARAPSTPPDVLRPG